MKKMIITFLFIFCIFILNNISNYESVVLDVINYNVYEEKKVALTFDDGPSIKTIDLVNLLKKYNIKVTFFLLGENVRYYKEELLYITNNGHEIGNHSYTHPDFKTISIKECINEVNKTQEIIYEVSKLYPKIFRFPYGSYDYEILKYINLPIIFWNVDSFDWKYLNQNIIVRNVTLNLKSESIILFHDSINLKIEAIENVIKFLVDQDYRFVTISELYFEENLINGKLYY